MRTAIWWIRRDLRLANNEALKQAVASSDQVVPLFILDPKLLESDRASGRRIAFMIAGLKELDNDLKKVGSRLILKRGKPVEVFGKLQEELPFDKIFAQADISPYASRRDKQVHEEFPLEFVGSPGILPPGRVLKPDGTPYVVFTPFKRRWEGFAPPSLDPIQPEWIQTPGTIRSAPWPVRTQDSSDLFPAGEASAIERLQAFSEGDEAPIFNYENVRNRLDLAATSSLSPYLRFGMVSPNHCHGSALAAANDAANSEAHAGANSWINQLAWRDFFLAILYHFPTVLKQNFRPKMDNFPWSNDPDDLSRWQEGLTGYPVIDAAMRQLAETGWMHNRARMLTASFLTKDLLIHWRWGEKWFMQQLIDGDPASNNGGWQWAAGTGADAGPYFRIFNPVTQSKKFDPTGLYIRRWVPELARVPFSYIHEPWKMPSDDQRATGCIIGVDYPGPMIDHIWARERALSIYQGLST